MQIKHSQTSQLIMPSKVFNKEMIKLEIVVLGNLK